jgi:preprotein translocase subunit SecY
MLSAFANCLKIPELRSKILFTFGLLFIARVGANIPLPGIDPLPLQTFYRDQATSGGSLIGLYNMFTGGALLKGALMSLGIMPYISASIIFQLLSAAVPSLARLQQEGELGRQKLIQYTRYATVVICIIQGTLLLLSLQNPEALFPGFSVARYGPIVLSQPGSALGISNHFWFVLDSLIYLTAGSLLLMWLGEKITQQGIGNGTSLIITVGILADLPSAIMLTGQMFFPRTIGVAALGAPQGMLMVALLLCSICGIIALTQAMRKVPVQYAKRIVGNKMMAAQTSYLPLKVNYSGVMPVIFASAILLFLQQIFNMAGAGLHWRFMSEAAATLMRGSTIYYSFYGFLILIFSYFWVSVMFKPVQVADEIKKHGGYIPGVRPGEATAKFLDFTMTRLTLAGAIFLTIIAVIPDILLFNFKIPYKMAQFFGGTGMLITVGVLLDTMRQIETYLLQRHYDGFIQKGRIHGASLGRVQSLMDTKEINNMAPLWITVGALFAIGMVAWVVNNTVLKI